MQKLILKEIYYSKKLVNPVQVNCISLTQLSIGELSIIGIVTRIMRKFRYFIIDMEYWTK